MIAGSLEIQLSMDVARISRDVAQIKGVVGSAMQGVEAAAATAARALGAIGVGLSIAGIIALTKSTVDAIARMKDLGQEAGTTASAISKFEAPARMAGLSLDSVAAAMFKMSKAALEAKDPTSKAAQALQAIGISTAQLKGLKPDEMFELVARSLGKYGDGLEKNAVMQELFGKSGREMNRVVAEIAETGKLHATVTDEQAEAADRLQDQIVELQMNSEKFWRSLVAEGVPAMNDILKAFIEGRKEGNLYAGMVAAVSAAFDKLFGKTPQLQLELVNQEIEAHKKSVKDLDALWAKLGMKINPEGQLAQAKAMNELLAKRALIEKGIHDADMAAQNKRAIAGQTAGKPVPGFDPAARAKAEAEAAKMLAAELKDLARIKAELLAIDQKTADEVQAIIDANNKMAADRVLAMQEEIDRYEIETKVIGMTNVERELELLNYRRALALRGPLDDAQRAAINLKFDELAVMVKLRDGAVQAREQNLEQIAMWDRMATAAGDFFGDLVMNGKSAFDNLKKMLKDLLAQMIALFAKRWILNMVGGGSMMGSAGSAAGSMLEGGSSLLGGASNLSSLGSLGTAGAWLGGATGLMTGGAAYAAAVPGLTAFGAGSQAALLAAQTGAFGAAGTAATAAAGAGATGVGAIGGAMTGVYSALAAIPVWGWIAMAVIAIGAYIAGNHKGGPKGGGSFIGEFDASGTMGRSQFGDRLYTPSNADTAMRSIVEATSAGFFKTLASLGGTSAGMTFGLGTDTDPQGTAANRITSFVKDALGQTVFSTLNRDIGRDEENVEPQLILETQRMILAALQASELPTQIAGILDGLVASSATTEQINAVIAAAQDMKTALDVIGEMGIAEFDIDAAIAMREEGETMVQVLDRVGSTFAATSFAFGKVGIATYEARAQLVRFAGGMENLMAVTQTFYEEFYSEEERRLRLETELRDVFASVGLQLPATRDAFRAIIEGLDLTSESGRKMYALLIQLSPAFASLVPAMNAVVGAGAAAAGPRSPYGPYGPTEMELYYMPEAVAARAELARLAAAFEDARESLKDWIDSLLLNEQLSPLTPMQQLEEARAQYQKTLALAKGGDLGAMQQLTGSSETYLRIAREIFASSSAYNDIFRDVIAGVGGVAGLTPADVNARLASALPQNSTLMSSEDGRRIESAVLRLIDLIANGVSVNDAEAKTTLDEINNNVRRSSNSGVLA